MRKKLQQTLLVLAMAYIFQAYGDDERDNIVSGAIVASYRGVLDVLPGLQLKNKSELIFNWFNTGKLDKGVANTNLVRLRKFQAASQKIKKLKLKSTCTLFDISMLLVKICPDEEKDHSAIDTAPRGQYNSTIRVILYTDFHDREWLVTLSLSLFYEVKMSDKKNYSLCSFEDKKEQKLSNETTKKKRPRIDAPKHIDEPSNQSKEEEVKAKEAKGPEADRVAGMVEAKVAKRLAAADSAAAKKKVLNPTSTKEHEDKLNKDNKAIKDSYNLSFNMDDEQNIGVFHLKRPVFLNITFKSKTEPKNGSIVNFTIITVEDLFLNKGEPVTTAFLSKEKTKVKITKLELTFEVMVDNGIRTILIYDKPASQKNTATTQDDCKTAVPRYILMYAANKARFPNVLLMEESPNEQVVTLGFNSIKKDEHIFLNKLILYIADEEQKITSFEREWTGDCDVNKRSALQWITEHGTTNETPQSNTAERQREPKAFKDLLACGVKTFELSTKECESIQFPNLTNIFVFYMKTRKIFNENGQEVGQIDNNEKRFQNKEIVFSKFGNKGETVYQTLEELEAPFMGKVRSTVNDVKKSLTTKYGNGIWKNAEYKSELKIVRSVACTSNKCQGTIRAVFLHNLTKKANDPNKRHNLRDLVKVLHKKIKANIVFERMLKAHQCHHHKAKPPVTPSKQRPQNQPAKSRRVKIPWMKIQRASSHRNAANQPAESRRVKIPWMKIQRASSHRNAAKESRPSLTEVVERSSPRIFFKPAASAVSKSRENDKLSQNHQKKNAIRIQQQREKNPVKDGKGLEEKPLLKQIQTSLEQMNQNGEYHYDRDKTEKEQMKILPAKKQLSCSSILTNNLWGMMVVASICLLLGN